MEAELFSSRYEYYLGIRCKGMWRGMVMGRCKGVWEVVITFKRYDSAQGGVKVVRNVCQLMERCDAHERSVQELGEV